MTCLGFILIFLKFLRPLGITFITFRKCLIFKEISLSVTCKLCAKLLISLKKSDASHLGEYFS